MHWKAVAIDHWVTTTPAGKPVSIKRWPLGWTLITTRDNGRRPPICLNFGSLARAVNYIKMEQL